MRTDVTPRDYDGYIRASIAPSSVPVHTTVASLPGERSVSPQNQTATTSGYSPAVLDAAQRGRRIPTSSQSRPGRGGGYGQMRTGGIKQLVMSPLGLVALGLGAYFLLRKA